jgi:hypothetical protein
MIDDSQVPVGLASAGATLAHILGDTPNAGQPDCLAVWRSFREFAEVRVRPEGSGRLDPVGGDLLLFEWGVFHWPWSDALSEVFLVDLVRQFSLIRPDNEYDHMEQVHCSLGFEPVDSLRQLGSGTIWSNGDREEWSAEVETSDGFIAIRSAIPVTVHVEQERL